MKLLVISNTFPSKDDSYIGDIFVKEQLKYLKNYVEEIYVVSPLPYGIELSRKIKQANYAFENVKVYFPRFFVFPLFYYYMRTFWVKSAVTAILELIKSENIRFDLIHAHYTWPSGALGIELKRIMNKPVVITEHTHVSLYKEMEKRTNIYLDTWNGCDAIIRVNARDIKKFIKLGINENKLHYIPNGYDPKKFYYLPKETAREILRIDKSSKIIFNLSMLNPIKGHIYLIDAMLQVLKERSDVLCFIGGSGPLYEVLYEKIKKINLSNNVFLIGFIPNDQLNYWMNAADLFVLPSLSEGNPTVMFEALGVGLPFVGTKVGGVPEVITSEDYGLLVEPGNVEDLTEKILIALRKKWDRNKIKKYAERFIWENIAKEVLKVYNDFFE